MSNITCDKHNKCTYVSKKEAKKNRKGIFDIILDVNESFKQDKKPGFSAKLVGSAKRNLVFIKSENDSDYDHDIQIEWNSTKNPIEECGTKEIRDLWEDSFKESCKKKDWDINYYNSTSVVTIIKKDKNNDKIASFDIALIDANNNLILKYNKEKEEYIWNELPNVKDAYLKANNFKKDQKLKLRHSYLNLKCKNKDTPKDDKNHKSSSSLFIEAVNNVLNNSK